MTVARKALLIIVPALSLAPASVVATAHADDPPAHRVKYTVTAVQPTRASIYYLDNEPTSFATYSHNPYQWVPNIQADVGPNQPWVFELMLNDPGQWALVTASNPLDDSTGQSQAGPTLHCDLMVDGVVVKSKDGAKGVLCSLRNW